MANITNQKKHDAHEIINVAVILPVYNTALYLEECLDSFLEQTYEHFTIFAVNDGSSDNSGAILEKYAQRDSRIYVINKKNGGVSSARNVALEKIAEDRSFDLVCFSDSDDYVTPSYIATYVEQATRHNADYIACGWNFLDKTRLVDGGRKVDPLPITELDRDGAFRHAYATGEWHGVRAASASYFLSNRCFAWDVIQNERFDETMRKGEDQDFLIRALLNVRKGVVVSNMNYLYRLRASSLSHLNSSPADDMNLFMSLITKAKSYPDSAKEGLKQRAIELWWQSVRYAILTNTFSQHNLQLTEAYKRLKIFSYSIPLPSRAKKRLKLFSLGEYFLKVYFFFTNKRIKKNNKENYFD